MIKTKKANIQDIPLILPLVKRFVKESEWGWKYNEKSSINSLYQYISSDETDVLYSVTGGKVSGWAMVAWDSEFHEDKIGYVSKFYVDKKFRGSKTARALVKTICDWMDVMGCKAVFATATANIGSEKGLFENLFAKYGFKDCGNTIVRI